MYKAKLPLESFNKSTVTSCPRTFQRKILPSSQRACAYFWVIVTSLCDENMNFTQSFGGIFASVRMRYGGKVGSE